MYIECKDDGVSGSGRIGRVKFSKTGKSLYYQGQTFQTLRGSGLKSNKYDVDTGQHYWISGCKKNGNDRLYAGVVEIDADVAEEYWTKIRELPQKRDCLVVRDAGKY